MTNSNKLFITHQALPNIKFENSETKKGDVLFFVPETLSDSMNDEILIKFLNTQVKAYFGVITIPGVITSFLGKKLSSQKYYLKMKKDLPNYIYNRVPNAKLSDTEKTSVLDFSGVLSDILSVSKSRSQKQVFIEFQKLMTSYSKDYGDQKKYLFIKGDANISFQDSEFLNFLIYNFRLLAGKIKSDLDGIIYMVDKRYYPLTKKNDKGELVLLKNIISMIKQKKNKEVLKLVDLEQVFEDARNQIRDLIKQELTTEIQKNIKEIVHDLPLSGTYEEKLNALFSSDDQQRKEFNELQKIGNAINKKYNGTVEVDIPRSGVFDTQKIVGLNELGNYDKQRVELTENMDELIEDLVHSTLEKDPDINLKVKGIKSKIIDDSTNRYKEYQVKIQHDYGETTKKPYTISFRVPTPVNGKYIKLGGNNYILINQLFPSPLQKISPNLVRFYTHFSVASLSVKNSILTASNGFKELEEKFVTQLKAVKKISELKEFDNELKDSIAEEFKIGDLQDLEYSRMSITIDEKGNNESNL